ncbi:hypothetical protein [Paenibacillus sp. XY044]|uniref:hypothetical protein n=1 Tax=Paenibacillus sp. XY044 TaxID=2026089 RepID=UPI000B99AA0D|nr:hypothetical protein [Paenibacillus sp. XY044]OZB98468.1 hypothetical protein CJP46_04775 [Paenibacillus sp. XY044]
MWLHNGMSMEQQGNMEPAKCMALTVRLMQGINDSDVGDRGEVEDFYQELGRFVQDPVIHRLLVCGRFELVDAGDADVFAYKRSMENQQLLIVANMNKDMAAFRSDGVTGGQRIVSVYPDTVPCETMRLRPYEAFAVLITG